MQKKLRQNPKAHYLKIKILSSALTTSFLITGCQTTESKQEQQMAHVLEQQEILIDAVVAERQQEKVKAKVADSESLTTAELHLNAALNALKQSSQTLRKVIKNEQL